MFPFIRYPWRFCSLEGAPSVPYHGWHQCGLHFTTTISATTYQHVTNKDLWYSPIHLRSQSSSLPFQHLREMTEIRRPRTACEFQRNRDSCESPLMVQMHYHVCLAHLLIGRTTRRRPTVTHSRTRTRACSRRLH